MSTRQGVHPAIVFGLTMRGVDGIDIHQNRKHGHCTGAHQPRHRVMVAFARNFGRSMHFVPLYDRNAAIIAHVGPVSAAPDGTIPLMSIEGRWISASSPILRADSPLSPQDTSQIQITNDPKMLPPQFGIQAKMDNMDRRLFEFCMSTS
jgi:hypothetical protein